MTLAVSFVPDPAGVQPARRPALRAVPSLPDDARGRAVDPLDSTAVAPVAVLHAPVGADTAAPMRLTRRGVAVLTAAVAVLCGGLLWVAAHSAPTAAPARQAPAAVTVHPGDTLWAIASRVAPDADPRAEVAALQAANHLRGVGLEPGQVLRVPR